MSRPTYKALGPVLAELHGSRPRLRLSWPLPLCMLLNVISDCFCSGFAFDRELSLTADADADAENVSRGPPLETDTDAQSLLPGLSGGGSRGVGNRPCRRVQLRFFRCGFSWQMPMPVVRWWAGEVALPLAAHSDGHVGTLAFRGALALWGSVFTG